MVQSEFLKFRRLIEKFRLSFVSLDFPACRQAGLVRFFIDEKNEQIIEI
jgi:hypothetical protein